MSEKLGYDIFDFKVGDVLTRVQRGYKLHYSEPEYGQEIPKVTKVPAWGDFLGKPVIYHGIFNNQIHVQPEGKNNYQTLAIEEFSEGWDYYEKPNINIPEGDNNKKDDNRGDEGRVGVKVHEGVIVGEPPEFIKQLLQGKAPFEDNAKPNFDDKLDKLKNAFKTSLEQVTKKMDEEAEELHQKHLKHLEDVRKWEKQMDVLYLSFFGIVIGLNIASSFVEIPQTFFNTLFVVLVAILYAHMKIKKAKELNERTKASLRRLKHVIQKNREN